MGVQPPPFLRMNFGKFMKLRLAPEITIRRLSDASFQSVPLRHGVEGSSAIAGEYLVSALANEKYYLLFMVDNDCFPEVLSISLLDKSLKELDAAEVSGHLSRGSFSNLTLLSDNAVSFKFLGDQLIRLEIFSEPRFRIPFLCKPFGVWQKLALRTYFKITKLTR